MHSVTRTIFQVFAFKVMHRVILLTWFCKLLTRVATLSGGGHVPQVPQWHDASAHFPLLHFPLPHFQRLPLSMEPAVNWTQIDAFHSSFQAFLENVLVPDCLL